VSALASRLNVAALSVVQGVQNYVVLAWKALRFVFARPFYGGDLVQQMDVIGVQSLGIVLLTGFFTGMVLALQSSVQLRTFGATQYIGSLVSASMIRELGPVLAGLMVAGRVGSGVAAQIGSMRVTEQIDASTRSAPTRSRSSSRRACWRGSSCCRCSRSSTTSWASSAAT
jgi:phospholipid/cholesterol/gamma-HCH transport system permease protein